MSKLFLESNDLMVIFKKYLNQKEVLIADKIDSLLDQLIEDNLVANIKEIESGNKKLPNDPRVLHAYNLLKENYVYNQIKKLKPDNSVLSPKDLDKLRKRVFDEVEDRDRNF